MADQDEAPKFDDFDARLRRLRSDAGRGRNEPEARPKRASVGGGLIGYALDSWLETWPICFLVMFFLGAAAGMLNAYRHIRRWSDAPEEPSEDR